MFVFIKLNDKKLLIPLFYSPRIFLMESTLNGWKTTALNVENKKNTKNTKIGANNENQTQFRTEVDPAIVCGVDNKVFSSNPFKPIPTDIHSINPVRGTREFWSFFFQRFLTLIEIIIRVRTIMAVEYAWRRNSLNWTPKLVNAV